MKQISTLLFALLLTVSCKKDVVEIQVQTPTQPQIKPTDVGDFKIAQQTLDKWVYNTKKKLTFINKMGDTLNLRVREQNFKGTLYSIPVTLNSKDVFQYKSDQSVYYIYDEKDINLVSVILSVEPELKEKTDKVSDIVQVSAPYTDGKFYWSYMFYKTINFRTYTDKKDTGNKVKVDELTINSKVYKNVYTAPAINYSDSLGVISFYDTNKTQWSVVKIE